MRIHSPGLDGLLSLTGLTQNMKQVVTIFEDLYNKEPLYITVETALQRIQSGKQKQKIDRVRDGDKEAKKLLPIVLEWRV